MGVVYLAKDTLWEGRRLALKTLPVKNYSSEDVRNFKREFKTMVGLSHPNLVTVYDFGKISSSDDKSLEGDYYFTMEYVQGRDFYRASERAGYEMILDTATQICRALQYVHLNGLIHFDVKPDNIMIVDPRTGDGELRRIAKLMDLGLASTRAADRTVRGTVEYMAPELLRGEKVDQRADIYSLGVTLYQVLTRRLPFEGISELEIVKKQLSEVPPAVDAFAKDVSPILSGIIARMLAKNPDDRWSSATGVIEALEPLRGDPAVIKVDTEVPDDITTTRFVGRSEELEGLRRRLLHLGNRVIDYQPNYVSVVGESGIGKTRFLQEFKSDAQLEGIPFFEARCYSHSVHPYEPFTAMLRQAVRETRNHGVQGQHLLQKYSSELTRLLPELSEGDVQTTVSVLDPHQAKLRLEDSVTQFLLGLADIQPYIMYFDDFDFADEHTIDLMRYFHRNARGRPLLVCENHKPSTQEWAQRSVVSEEGERNVEEISLKEFQVEEIREFVKSALGLGKLSDQVVVWIRKEVGGSPFLISEFIRPIVRRVRAGAYYDEEKLLQELKNVKFPKSVLDLYRQRVDTLDLNSLKILEILSAFDTPIYCRLLNQFDELREVNVRESLDKLRRSGIIDFSEFKELCSISQGKVREMVYEKVPEGRKRELHMRIGSLQERFHGNRVDDHAEEIASHFEKGGDAEKAFSYYLAAAERAASIHARTHARTLYEKTLELALVRDLSVVPELMGKVGHAYLLTADYEKAASVYKQLLDLRLTTSEKVDVLRELATVLERRGDFEEAIRYINQALELADETQKKVEILNELAIIYIRRARYDEADRICLQALELTQSKVILNERADAFNNLGIIHVNRNEPEYAEECFKMSLEAREEVGNKLKIALSYTNLGILSNRRGDYETARYYSKKALQLSEEVGDIRHVARCNNNLGIIAYDQTEYEESLIYYKKALDIFVRTDDKAGSSWSWYNVGELQFKLCEYEQSLKSLERCLELYRCLDDMQGLAEAYDQLGMVYFTLGMSNEAWDCARKAQQLIQTSRIQTETGHNMLLLATLYAMVSEWDRSEETFLKAADFFKETGDETERCWAISMLGGMFSQKREFQKAIKLMDETFQVCPQDAFLKMEILLNLGTAYQYLHDRQSVVFLQDAYSLSEQVTVSEVSWKICFALFREYQSRGLLTKAYEYGEKTLLVLRHILSKFTQPDLADAYLNSHNRNGVINYIDQVGKPSPEES